LSSVILALDRLDPTFSLALFDELEGAEPHERGILDFEAGLSSTVENS
jgi:hypothetical protein